LPDLQISKRLQFLGKVPRKKLIPASMKKYILIYILAPFSTFNGVSCSDPVKDTKKGPTADTFKIVIISPYGECINEIVFSAEGAGTLKSGLSNQVGHDNITGIDTIATMGNFKIEDEAVLKKVTRYVDSLNKVKFHKRAPQTDSYHFKYFINDTIKVDLYGGSDGVFEILRLLVDELPLAADKCGFFKQFVSYLRTENT
jgi:hypothetical protein